MVKIIPKKCLYCKKFISIKRFSWKRPLTASHYARLKYCNYACSSANRNKIEAKWGRKSIKPDIGILNGLWSKTKSYKKISEILGVSYSSIKEWMGLQKYLIDPSLLAKGATLERMYSKKIDWEAIGVAKEKGEVYIGSRKEYYNTYHSKKMKDPVWVEMKRKYAREHARKRRKQALLV